jgi:hypothetical protein
MEMEAIDFDPKLGYPNGDDLFYECQRCKKLLPSRPDKNLWCDCYNLCVDVDAGRLAVRDNSLLKILRVTSTLE